MPWTGIHIDSILTACSKPDFTLLVTAFEAALPEAQK